MGWGLGHRAQAQNVDRDGGAGHGAWDGDRARDGEWDREGGCGTGTQDVGQGHRMWDRDTGCGIGMQDVWCRCGMGNATVMVSQDAWRRMGSGMGTRKVMETRDREGNRDVEWDEDGDAKHKVDKGRVHEPWKPSPTSTLDGGERFSSDNGEWLRMALTR